MKWIAEDDLIKRLRDNAKGSDFAANDVASVMIPRRVCAKKLQSRHESSRRAWPAGGAHRNVLENTPGTLTMRPDFLSEVFMSEKPFGLAVRAIVLDEQDRC